MANYGSSGDVRMLLNQGLPATHANYEGEGQIAGTLITYGLTQATNEINAKLKARYGNNIPFTTVPAIIDNLTNDLAICVINYTMALSDDKLSKNKYKGYCEQARELLKMIANGEITLPEITSPQGDEVYNSNNNYIPVMSMDDVENSKIDSDLLDDIASDRK